MPRLCAILHVYKTKTQVCLPQLIDKILVLLGAKGEVVSMGISYGKIQFLGLGFFFSTFTIYTALRGIGNPSMAMAIMLGSTALNMILDPFFIFGWWFFPELGVVGAAVASVISYIIAFSTGLVIFFSGKCNVPLHLKSQVKLKVKSLLKIMEIGLPLGVNQMSFSFARLIVMPLVAVFGTEVDLTFRDYGHCGYGFGPFGIDRSESGCKKSRSCA